MRSSNTDRDTLAELGYEPRDVQVRPVMIGLVGLGVFIFTALIVTLGIYNFFSPRYQEERALPTFVTERKLPPHPQLQVNPKEDMHLYHQAEDARAVVIEQAKAKAAAAGISGVVGEEIVTPKSFPGGGFVGGAVDTSGMKVEGH